MKQYQIRINQLPFILALCTLLLGRLGYAQDDKKSMVRIALSAEPVKREYVLGEPVVMKVKMRNWLGPRVLLSTNLDLKAESTILRIIKKGRPGDIYRAFYEGAAPLTEKEYMLGYGQAIQSHYTVLYDKDDEQGLALAQPGPYRFQINQEIYALNTYLPNPLRERKVVTDISEEITVVEPDGRNREAFELLKKTPICFRDLNRQIASYASIHVFRKVVQEYGDTVYAPYAADAIASFYWFLASEDVSQRKTAIEMHRKALERYPDYIFYDELSMTLSELLSQDGQLNEAVAVAKEVLDRSIENLFLFRKFRVMREIRGLRGNRFNQLINICWPLFDPTELAEAYAQISLERGEEQ